MSGLIVNRPLIWRIFDDSDDEDRDDFEISEIRCCNCFFDQIKNLVGGKTIVTFDFLYKNLIVPKSMKWSISGDIFLFYSGMCVFSCENFKSNFERICGLDKDEMDKYCLAHLNDYHCVYFLSRETMFYSICDGCRRTLLKNISEKLIRIKI